MLMTPITPAGGATDVVADAVSFLVSDRASRDRSITRCERRGSTIGGH
jgi:hypothetical protein